ncbi:MAG: redoxin domain-containing protein [Planctomycetota bacterium]|nr:redoxin domain-containing protein [Planctomycetota bacterium]RLS26015.1 MAG: peroxiredoxin [Planctomycetota bacterium]
MIRFNSSRLLLMLCIAAGFVSSAQADLKVGDKAPDFSLKASDGKTYKLADFAGKQAVVIAWFPRAFTGGCTAECKSLRATTEALKPTGSAYFTASCDDAETNGKFAKSLDLDYPILSDPEKNTAKAYGVVHEGRASPERWTFYIDKNGVIKEIDKKIRTAQAGPDVVAKLKDLGLSK